MSSFEGREQATNGLSVSHRNSCRYEISTHGLPNGKAELRDSLTERVLFTGPLAQARTLRDRLNTEHRLARAYAHAALKVEAEAKPLFNILVKARVVAAHFREYGYTSELEVLLDELAIDVDELEVQP